MKTLIIKDLPRTEQLDRTEMASVRGGWMMNSPYSKYGNTPSAPQYASSIHATQNLMQFQSVVNETADGSAFLSGVTAKNDTSQTGQNNITVH